MNDDHKWSSDELALHRTVMAAVRTLMAWVRTTLAMISFGFSIDKFYQYLHESGRLAIGPHPQGPRNLGLTLITLGLAALTVACVQYARQVRRLTRSRHVPLTLPFVVAACVVLIGVLALANLLFGVGPF